MTSDTSHEDISELNFGTSRNMFDMSVTEDTSHEDTVPLNDDAL